MFLLTMHSFLSTKYEIKTIKKNVQRKVVF